MTTGISVIGVINCCCSHSFANTNEVNKLCMSKTCNNVKIETTTKFIGKLHLTNDSQGSYDDSKSNSSHGYTSMFSLSDYFSSVQIPLL
jgi:hypothetical protein